MKRKSLITVLFTVLTLALSLCVFTACGGGDGDSSLELNEHTSVYTMKVTSGASGLTDVEERGGLGDQFVVIGSKGIDFTKVVVMANVRMPDGTIQFVEVPKDKYTIDYGGFDVNKKGIYYVNYSLAFAPEFSYLVTVRVAESFVTVKMKSDLGGTFVVDRFPNRITEFEKIVSKGETITFTAFPESGFAVQGWYIRSERGAEMANPLGRGRKYVFTAGDEDFSGIVKYCNSINGAKMDISGIYQMFVSAGESGFVSGEPDSKGYARLRTTQFVAQGDKTKDINKLEVYGIRRARENRNVIEYLQLDDTCYDIDFGGLDYDVSGKYTVTITTKNDTPVSSCFYIEVYEKDDSLSVAAYLNGNGSFVDDGYVTPNGYYRNGLNPNDEITIEAKADEGYEFAGWYYNTNEGITANNFISAETKHTFTIGAENLSLIAYFREKLDVSKISRIIYSVGDSGLAEDQAKLVTTYDVELNEKFEKKMKLVSVSAYTTDQKVIELLYGIDYILEADVEFDNTHVDTSVQGYYHFNYIPQIGNFEKLTIKVNVHDYKTISIDSGNYDMGTAADAGGRKEVKVNNGNPVRIIATPKQGYKFVKWVYYDNNEEVVLSTEADYVFALTEDMFVYAVFEAE